MKKPIIITLASLGILLVSFGAYYLFNSFASSNNNTLLCSGDILFPFQEKEDGDWGFIDYQGNEVISPEFNKRPSLAKNGMFLLKEQKKNKTYYQFYKITDNKAKEIGDPWDNAHMFSDGLAAVAQENKYIQFINEEMKVVFTLDKIETSGNFIDGMVRVQNEEGKWGFANKDGNIIIKAEYDEVSNFNDGKAVVQEIKGKEDKQTVHFGIINKEGDKLLNLKDKYSNVYFGNEGYYIVKETHDNEVEYGFINESGEKVIKPKDFQEVTFVLNGHFSYKEEGEWGLKNMEGEKVFSAKYEEALWVFNDLVWYKKDGEDEYGAMDLEGNEIIDQDYNEFFPFICNTTFVKDGRDYIFIDKEGEAINKNEYRNIYSDESSFYSPVLSNDGTYMSHEIQSDYFDVSSFTTEVKAVEISRLLNKSIRSIQSYFASDESNKKALIDNSNGYHKSAYDGEYDRYNGGYPRVKLWWSKKDINFYWKVNKDNSSENSSSFQPSKLGSKNISSININTGFSDYIKTKVISRERAQNINNSDIKDYVRINSGAKLEEITVTINTQGKAYGKTHKIAEAFGNELKKLIDSEKDDFNEEKSDGKYNLSGSSNKMSVQINHGNYSITIKFKSILEEVVSEEGVEDAESYDSRYN